MKLGRLLETSVYPLFYNPAVVVAMLAAAVRDVPNFCNLFRIITIMG